MDRAVKSRKPSRAGVTKICNEIEAEIATMVPFKKLLVDLVAKLDAAEEKLRSKDGDVEEAMLDENKTDQDLETEYEQTEVYYDRIRIIKKAVEYAVTAQIEVPDDTSSHARAINQKGDIRSFKLPKIELPKFNGDLKNWLGWWSQFEKIDKDKNLHNSDKFQYLIDCDLE